MVRGVLRAAGTGIAAGAAEIAQIIFFLFVVLLVLSLLFGNTIWKKISD